MEYNAVLVVHDAMESAAGMVSYLGLCLCFREVSDRMLDLDFWIFFLAKVMDFSEYL